MRVTVIGTGYVGLVTGTCLAELGNQVICLDVDAEKIRLLNKGESPIYEPGLTEMIRANLSSARLRFTTHIEEAIHHGDILFIAVGTPPSEDGSADISHVLAAAQSIDQWMTGFKVIVDKSTVPVGTAEKVQRLIDDTLGERCDLTDQMSEQTQACVISNPEFLKEGAAIEDFMRPDRIILGIGKGAQHEQARELMRQLYTPFNRNHDRTLVMDIRSAELTKYAANAMLATRISFMNEIANLAEYVGADIESVRQGIGSDPRIGYSFLYAGTGYGGSCFPKDVKALQKTGADNGIHLRLQDAVEAVNQTQKHVLVQKLIKRFGRDLHDKRFAVWGLTFKPGTDDMREAPSRVVIQELLQLGAHVVAHDPVANHAARLSFEQDLHHSPKLLERLRFHSQAMPALEQADALLILTEWKAFKSPDFLAIHRLLKQPVIFDGRNLYEPEMMANAGFHYEGVGRSAHPVIAPSNEEWVAMPIKTAALL
jgi:UDPglucose 6-dehydrogenase